MNKLIVALLVASGCYSSEENLGFTVVGEPRWAIGFGERGNDRAYSTAFDSIGDVIIAGYTSGPRNPATNDLLPSVPFLTKRVASDGAERWTVRLRGLTPTSNVWIAAIAVTRTDDIIVVGDYVGSVDFGGQTLSLTEPDPPDHGDNFIAKYSPEGVLRWVKGTSEYSNAQTDALVLGPDDTIYIGAHFAHGQVVLDGQEYREVDGNPDMILVAYDPNGARRWFHVFQAVGGAIPRSMAIATNGDLLVAGMFNAPTSFGGAVVNANSRERTFFARYRSDGLYLESRAMGLAAPWTSWEPQLEVDAFGRIVVQQIEKDESQSYMDWDATLATLRVFADDGAELWSLRVPNHGNSSPPVGSLLTTPSGLIATASWVDAPYNVDDRGSVTGQMEVVAFDTDGSKSVSTFANRMWAAPNDTAVRDTAVSSSQAIAFAGTFAGTIDFGTGPLMTSGQDDSDAFVVVVNPPRVACDQAGARRQCP